MAIVPKPGSADPSEGEDEQYAHDHPHESPEDWGWHGEWGKYARVAGWITAIILIVMASATHYNDSGRVALWAFAAFIVIALVVDINRRRTSWRK